MNIIVVDDSDRKIDRIRAALISGGATTEQIHIAKTGIEARRSLSRIQYDLLVLDIALPMHTGDEPDKRGGIKLLEEIIERENLRLPLSVVGLTGFEDLYAEFREQFHSRLWTLDYFDSSDIGWLERLKAKVSYVRARSEEVTRETYETDLCVVTALRTPELLALRNLEWNWSETRSLDEVGFYYEGTMRANDQEHSVIAAAAPRMGMVASALLAQKMISSFRPKLICMVGICAGVKGRCEIGDVLVADPAWDWQMGKYEVAGFSFAPDQIDLSAQVAERFVQLGDDREFWYDLHGKYGDTKPPNVPTVKVGPVASGSAVLADEKVVSRIREQHRQLLGVEMELYGVYAAAKYAISPQTVAFGIKSVADFADENKADDYQRYAAHVSARVLEKYCSLYL
ncbi:MAG: hypothetical protein OXF79_15015 [Chloroflexi bacterium]|nr:hypothetical protein [Chloroflexota bacterium]